MISSMRAPEAQPPVSAETPALDPRLRRRLRLLARIAMTGGFVGYNCTVQGGAALTWPWSLVVREGRWLTVEAGEVIGFLGGLGLFVTGVMLSGASAEKPKFLQTIQTPMALAVVMGIIGGLPAATAFVVRATHGALGGGDLFLVVGGLVLLGASCAAGMGLTLWREHILEYERLRATLPRAQRQAPWTRSRVIVPAICVVPVAVMLGWGLGPWFPSAKANEERAVGVVSALSFAQMHFRLADVVDQDGDRDGEYGFFDELVGLVPPRGSRSGAQRWHRLPAGFEPTAVPGVLRRHGYLFVMYLPSAAGKAVAAPPAPGAVVASEGAFQGERWVAYAWPEEDGVTGSRAYVADESHLEYVTDMKTRRYSGLENRPSPDAALSDAKGRISIPGVMSYSQPVPANLNAVIADAGAGLKAADGNRWMLIR